MKYSEEMLRYFESAAAAGELHGPGIFRGSAGARSQGTWVQFDLRVDSGIVREARFLAFACPHTIAVCQWVAERSTGREVVGALPESVAELSRRFGVPVDKRGRLLIVEDAWIDAVAEALPPQ
jgi:NifU-like protein involved in Fe-S cluster formation